MAARKNGFANFSKVKVARQALRDKAEEILAEYMDTIAQAKSMGDHATAAKMLQWLLEHLPGDEDGSKMIDVGIDKNPTPVQTGPTGPTIQIGIAVGGVPNAGKALPKPEVKAISGEIIDVSKT